MTCCLLVATPLTYSRSLRVHQIGLKGEFGLSFSETWGSPYDPHSYVSAWEAEDNANHNALAGLEAPSSRDELLALVEASQGLMFLFVCDTSSRCTNNFLFELSPLSIDMRNRTSFRKKRSLSVRRSGTKYTNIITHKP